MPWGKRPLASPIKGGLQRTCEKVLLWQTADSALGALPLIAGELVSQHQPTGGAAHLRQWRPVKKGVPAHDQSGDVSFLNL